MSKIDNPDRLSALSLAFVGDAVYEMAAREYIITHEQLPSGELHDRTVKIVCAAAQAKAAVAVYDLLSDAEAAVFRRGRNAHPSHKSKSATSSEYSRATALEALFGYLYLNGEQNRINELWNVIIGTFGE